MYRRVQDDPRNFKEEGEVSAAAFGDRSRKPSVDRAWLKDYEPQNSRRNLTDCIVCLVTGEVRTRIDLSSKDIDVVPDPISGHPVEPDNLAHALIVTIPEFDNDSQFRRLRRALAKRAKMLVPPGGTS